MPPQTSLDRLDVIINQNQEPSAEEDDEVQSTNIHANHDLQAEAPQSTEESPMTENACGPSQDQVKMNMPEKGKENEENTSPLEGGTSHLSRSKSRKI